MTFPESGLDAENGIVSEDIFYQSQYDLVLYAQNMAATLRRVGRSSVCRG